MSSKTRLHRFLENYSGSVSRDWIRQIARRAASGADWPDPWVVAESLGLNVVVCELDGIRFAVVGNDLIVRQHEDRRVMGHRVATAVAHYLLRLSNARWTVQDGYLLAFELLMPYDSVRRTPAHELVACQPCAHPNLLAGWSEHVAKTA